MSGWWDKKLGTQTTTPQNQPQPQHSGPRSFKNLDEALKSGYAGDGSRLQAKSSRRCPNCGSVNVFARTNTPFGATDSGSGTIYNEDGKEVVVSARCFECNWNSAGYDLSAW